MPRPPRHLRSALTALAALTLAACGASTATKTAPERHPIHGVIQCLDATAHTATIKHGDIPGFMSAMTMEFPVKDPAAFARLHPGETINGTVFVQDSDFWVGDIKEGK